MCVCVCMCVCACACVCVCVSERERVENEIGEREFPAIQKESGSKCGLTFIPSSDLRP